MFLATADSGTLISTRTLVKERAVMVTASSNMNFISLLYLLQFYPFFWCALAVKAVQFYVLRLRFVFLFPTVCMVNYCIANVMQHFIPRDSTILGRNCDVFWLLLLLLLWSSQLTTLRVTQYVHPHLYMYKLRYRP